MATKTNSLFKWKSWYAKLLFAFFMTVFSSHTLYAYDFEVDGVYYKINKDGESVEVTYKNIYDGGYSADIIIPLSVSYYNKTYSVTSIGDWAFQECRFLTSIFIPESVMSIGNGAFSDCSSLTSISIPESVTNIEESAFYGCRSLTSISIPEGVTSIGYMTFSYCSSLTSISLPESVVSIGQEAFCDCSSLTSFSIPESVTNIGPGAFSGCSSLTFISIPKSMTSIEDQTFYRCSSLASIYIPEGVTSIGVNAFRECSSLTSVSIPESVTSIEDGAFMGCYSLTSINVAANNPIYDSRAECNAIIETSSNMLILGCQNTIIPDGITSIGTYAFFRCSSITFISIPKSVTSIGACAFSTCSSLTSIFIPEGVTSIGGMAFSDCFSLTSISIPEGVTNIGDRAFYGCSALTSITVASSNPVYDSREGCNAIIETSSNTLIQGCQNTVIPENITNIGNYAFYQCSSLTSISIPKGVTNIGNSAFMSCSSLTSVICYAENVPVLGGNYVFYNIPTSEATLYVPSSALDKYKAADQWKDFGKILSIRVKINEGNFPDDNFRNYLLHQPYGEDGYITDEEIENITLMDVSNCSISSLQGLEYFTALTTLYCNNNQIATLDVSNNTALTALLCYDNLLSALDISKNTKLTHLDCSDNDLTIFDTSNNPALTWLYCHNNQLSALDLSQNTVLRYLYCHDNNLTTLDVSRNTELKSLECYNNNICDYAMDTFISSLSMNMSSEPQTLRLFTDDMDEGNYCTMDQAQAIKAKGWIPMVRIDGFWVEYERPTAISNPNAEIKNDDNAEYYTLDGVRIEKPTKKGIYIKNGKKVVIK